RGSGIRQSPTQRVARGNRSLRTSLLLGGEGGSLGLATQLADPQSQRQIAGRVEIDATLAPRADDLPVTVVHRKMGDPALHALAAPVQESGHVVGSWCWVARADSGDVGRLCCAANLLTHSSCFAARSAASAFSSFTAMRSEERRVGKERSLRRA